MNWTHELLWQKAARYFQRAQLLPRDSTEFGLFSAVSIEFLGRSALASVHPSMLADPGDDNILYACSVVSVKNPRSVQAKTVFVRCKHVIEAFTKDDFTSVMLLIDMRNEEVHSGGLPFETLEPGKWLPGYFRAGKKLAEFQGRSIEAWLGNLEAGVANKVLRGAEETLIGKIKKRVGAHATIHDELTDKDRIAKQALVDETMDASRWTRGQKIVSCPACKSKCLLTGEEIRRSEPVLDEDEEICVEVTVLPTVLECCCCSLHLASNDELNVVELGGLFTFRECTSPIEYYARDFADYYAEDERY